MPGPDRARDLHPQIPPIEIRHQENERRAMKRAKDDYLRPLDFLCRFDQLSSARHDELRFDFNGEVDGVGDEAEFVSLVVQLAGASEIAAGLKRHAGF